MSSSGSHFPHIVAQCIEGFLHTFLNFIFHDCVVSPPKVGAPDKIRTHDLQVRSLALYPTELRARLGDIIPSYDFFDKRGEVFLQLVELMGFVIYGGF